MRISSMLSGALSFQSVAIKPVSPTFQSYSFPCPTVQGMMRDAYTALTFTNKSDEPKASKPIKFYTGDNFIDWALTRLQEEVRVQSLLREMREDDDEDVVAPLKKENEK